MKKIKFPSIKNIAKQLYAVSNNVEGECDVRLQVYEDSQWAIRIGDSSYDQDHRGYWGASCVPGVNSNGIATRFSSVKIAKNLLNQVKDMYEDNK